MTQPSKTGRMISALDLANRIVADAERYHAALIAAFFDPYGQHEDVTGMTLILLTTAALMFYVALLIERREDDHR